MLKGRIFYKVYFSCIVLFMVVLVLVLVWLNGWLLDYEASQPMVKCEEVFKEYFAAPDWGRIYETAGGEQTQFEGKESYEAYMNQKVGDEKLTYTETSAGLSGDHKYFVKLGEEKIASFTLTADTSEKKGIVRWKFGGISLDLSRNQRVRILKQEGHTVLLNGVALDDSYTIQTSKTVAEAYLPEGLTGPRTALQQAEGFLTEPTVQILDEKGTSCEVMLDSKTGIYTEQGNSPKLGKEDERRIWDFAENYCRYMIKDYNDLKTLFDTKSKIYQVVRNSERWAAGKYKSYSFDSEALSDYYPYSDEIFSVKISLLQKVVRQDGTIREYPMDSTVFFKRKADGGILAIDMTNVEVLEPKYEVRLVWRDEEKLLRTDMVDAESASLTSPVVSVPEGYHFSGWMKELSYSDGTVSRALVFVPKEDGTIRLPAGYELEPMTLYPLIEKDE